MTIDCTGSSDSNTDIVIRNSSSHEWGRGRLSAETGERKYDYCVHRRRTRTRSCRRHSDLMRKRATAGKERDGRRPTGIEKVVKRGGERKTNKTA